MRNSVLEGVESLAHFNTANGLLSLLLPCALKALHDFRRLELARCPRRESRQSKCALNSICGQNSAVVAAFARYYVNLVKAEVGANFEVSSEEQIIGYLSDLIEKRLFALKLFCGTEPSHYHLDSPDFNSISGTFTELFLPFIYMCCPWLVPIEGHSIVTKWSFSADKHGEFCSLSELRVNFLSRGVYVTQDYLLFHISQQEDLLAVKEHGKAMITAMHCHFKNYELHFCLAPYRLLKKARDGDRLAWLQIRHALSKAGANSLLEIVERSNHSLARFIDKIWAVKRRHKEMTQGLEHQVHDAIVKELEAHGKALSYRILCKNLRVADLPISPAELPPGRIMAYGMSRFHHEKQHSWYVLREWVATELMQKGRILRDRIITPFVDKEYLVSEQEILSAIESNYLFCELGLFNCEEVAIEIAYRLPSKPMELYFRTQLVKQIETYAAYVFLELGKDFWIRKEAVTLLRRKNENIRSYRTRVILDLLKLRDSSELSDFLDRAASSVSDHIRILMR